MLTLQTELAARTRYKRVKLALGTSAPLPMQLGYSREENTMDLIPSTMHCNTTTRYGRSGWIKVIDTCNKQCDRQR
jgi:hypothetical protein